MPTSKNCEFRKEELWYDITPRLRAGGEVKA